MVADARAQGQWPSPLDSKVMGTTTRKGLLWAEWLILFWVYPGIVAMDWLVGSRFLLFAVPVGYALVVYALGGCGAILEGPFRRQHWFPLAGRIAGVAVFLLVYAALLHRDSFFILPRERPQLWLMIVMLYPLVSAFPQEFLYRSFYFRRYRAILPLGLKGILINAAAFGFLHIIYDNVPAVLLSFAAGIVFASVYLKTGKLTIPWIEHALYGLMVFTFGLGLLFYKPV
jgi:uncharacterized protein